MMLSGTSQRGSGLSERLVRRWFLIVTASLSLGACTTYPDSMHLDMRGIELVPSNKYIPARARDEQALAILFEGRAPFATIDAEGLLAQFHCELRDAANKAVSISDMGYAYFDGPATEVDPKSGLMLLSYPNGHKERLNYRAVVFFGLKSRTTINGPDDVDLLRSSYDHISCQLKGTNMTLHFIASNELILSKQEVVALAAAHQ